MLAAQNQDNQPESENQRANSPQPSGFGKVLGSLHGLQRRLDDFSIEDVSNADANVKSLIQQIIFIRERLSTLAELKQWITEANERIASIPEEDFDLVNPDGLEKHPQLHAIVQASKLIRFYRLMQAARASADAISFDTETGAMVAAAIERSSPMTETISENSQSIQPQDLITALSSDEKVPEEPDVIVTPALSDTLTLESEPANETAAVSALTPPAPLATEAELESAPAISPLSAIDSIAADADIPTVIIENHLPGTIDASTEPADNDFVMVATDSAHATIPQTTSLAIIEKTEEIATEKTNVQARGAKHRGKKKKPAETSTTQNGDTKSTTTLDKRLLDDLIKQYGDFAVTSNLPVPVETAKRSKAKPAAVVSANIPEFDGPIFEEPIIENRNSGQIQKAGELDRQLKKIIKDYGENDIYSRRSTLNLKTGGIIAFVVLGLVLGGIYLFKSPAQIQTPSSQSESSAPSNVSENGRSAGGQNGAAAGTTENNVKRSEAASKPVSKLKK